MRPHPLMMALLVAAVGVAACSGGSAGPSVAKLASSGATTTTSAGGGAAGGAGASGSSGSSGSSGASGSSQGGAPGGGPSAQDEAKLEAYAQCMRSHGVAAFPDPGSGGNGGYGFQIKGGPGTGLDPNSSTFQAADQACKKLLPNGGVGRQLTPAQQQAFLNWAQCVREHGVPDFPDPNFSGGGVRIRINAGSGSPGAMQTAQNACKSKLPAGFGFGAGG